MAHFVRPAWRYMQGAFAYPEVANATHAILAISGDLDFERVAACGVAAAARHPILAAQVRETEDGPAFCFGAPTDIKLRCEVLNADRDAALDRVRELIWQPFDIEQERFFRLFCVSRSTHKHFVCFVLHHFVGDFVSLSILKEQFLADYCSGQAPVCIAPQTLAYPYYASALARWGQSRVGRESEYYWDGVWEGAPTTLLPKPKKNALDTPHYRREIGFAVPHQLTTELKRLAARLGVTLVMLLLAAKFRVLRSFVDQDEFWVLVVDDRRDRGALRHMVGNLSDPMPVRLRVEKGEKVQATADRLRGIMALNKRHALSPTRLWGREKPVVGPSFNFIYERKFVMPDGAQYLPSFSLPERPLGPNEHLAHYFSIRCDGAKLRGMMRFSTGACDEANAARFVSAFCQELAEVVRD